MTSPILRIPTDQVPPDTLPVYHGNHPCDTGCQGVRDESSAFGYRVDLCDFHQALYFPNGHADVSIGFQEAA